MSAKDSISAGFGKLVSGFQRGVAGTEALAKSAKLKGEVHAGT